MSEQLFQQIASDLGRLADAAEVIARHLDPEGARRLGKHLPNLRRTLADYATFDWSSIGARVVATDRSGATEVEYRGVVCKRRSGEDAKKGKAIWFNTVVSGTVQEGNVTYERLITFRDGTPAEPLGAKVEQVVEHAKAERQQPPAQQREPQPVAVPIAPSAPLPDKQHAPVTEDPLLAELRTVSSEALKVIGTIPLQYVPPASTKPDEIRRMIDGLKLMVEEHQRPDVKRSEAERQEFVRLCAQHSELCDIARDAKVELPNHLMISHKDTNEHVAMKNATLTNYLRPHVEKAKAAKEPLRKAEEEIEAVMQKAATIRTPEQLKAFLIERAKKYPQRAPSLLQRGQTVEATNAVTAQHAEQIVRFVFGKAIDELRFHESQALFDYIRPSKENGHYVPTNLNAAAELMAVVRQIQP